MSRIVRADPYLTREDTEADQGRTPAVQHYEKQNGSDGQTSNTVFTLSKPYVQGSNTLVVYVNGQKAELLVSASDETEYEETTASTITFGASLLDTDVVEFMVYGTYFIQDTDILQPSSNVIINGDFNIWQRDSSFAAIANDTYHTDRCFYGKVGAMVHTVSRSTDVPTQVESGHLSNYSLLTDCTTADASIAAGDILIQQYAIEGYDFAPFVGNYGTLSFWVKGTKTGIHCVAFTNGSDRSYVAEYTINTADTWEKKQVTVNFNFSGGTWAYDNSLGMKITWALACGSTYQTTADAWQSGLFYGTANQVNACDSTANDFRLAQIKMEIGQIATPWRPRPYKDELTLCQRYFCKTYNQGVAVGSVDLNGCIQNRAQGTASSQLIIKTNYPVVMRATPTLTWYSPDSGNPGYVYNGSTTSDVAVNTDNRNGGDRATGYGGLATAPGDLQPVYGHITAEAEL